MPMPHENKSTEKNRNEIRHSQYIPHDSDKIK